MADGGEPSEATRPSRRGALGGQLLAIAIGAALAGWTLRANDVWLERHMTPMHCVAEVGQLAGFHVSRGVTLVLAFVAWVWLRPRLGRFFGAWAAKRSTSEAIVSVASIVVALVLAVVVTDVFLRWQRSRAKPWPADPFNRGVPASKDDLGFRLIDNQPIDPEKDTIVFNGESVGFGWGLADDETIPALVGAGMGMQTRNLALGGSANDEAFMRLRDNLPRLPKTRAVVTFVVINWLYRNVGLHREYLSVGAHDELTTSGPYPLFLQTSPLFEKARAVYHAEDPVEICRLVLRDTAKLVRASGAYPLFVFTQCGDECLSNGWNGPRIYQRLVEGQDFDFVRVDQDKSLWLKPDYHPNREGAKRYAVAIEEALRKKGINGSR